MTGRPLRSTLSPWQVVFQGAGRVGPGARSGDEAWSSRSQSCHESNSGLRSAFSYCPGSVSSCLRRRPSSHHCRSSAASTTCGSSSPLPRSLRQSSRAGGCWSNDARIATTRVAAPWLPGWIASASRRWGSRVSERKSSRDARTMPGWQYALEPAQLDQIVAFLKTVTPDQRPAGAAPALAYRRASVARRIDHPTECSDEATQRRQYVSCEGSHVPIWNRRLGSGRRRSGPAARGHAC